MPDTLNYLYLGLGMTVLIMSVFLGSLFVRRRNLEKDIAIMAQLEDEQG